MDDTNHDLRIENESEEVPDPYLQQSWVERRLTGKSRTTCTCGLNTGLVDSGEARDVFQEHRAQTQGDTPTA